MQAPVCAIDSQLQSLWLGLSSRSAWMRNILEDLLYMDLAPDIPPARMEDASGAQHQHSHLHPCYCGTLSPPAPSLHRFTWMRDAGIPISDRARPSLPTSLETLHLHRKPTDWHLLLKNNFTDMGEKHTWKESWTP